MIPKKPPPRRRKPRRRFKIPARFQLAGHVVKVVTNKPSPKKEPLFGRYDEATQTIYVYLSARGSIREETFCHELLHAIKSVLGMSQKESIVQGEGALLHQVLSTMEYD